MKEIEPPAFGYRHPDLLVGAGGWLSPKPAAPAAPALASAHEHWRHMQKSVVVDLLDKEICHVGARDEPACPAVRIDQCAIGVCLWPIGQDHGTHDHPVERAPPDDPFLHVLVVIDAAQQQMKYGAIKKPPAAAAVARPKARHANQPLDLSL